MSATSPTADQVRPRSFDENAADVVRMLMASRRLDTKAFAPLVGMTRSTLYNRLGSRHGTGGAWLASELDAIAGFFDVPPSVFFKSVEDVVGDQNRKMLTGSALRVLDGDDEPTEPGPGQLALPFPQLRLVKG